LKHVLYIPYSSMCSMADKIKSDLAKTSQILVV
jgi:hypothetical protein